MEKQIKRIKFKANTMAFNGFKKAEIMKKLAKYVDGEIEISINKIEQIVDAELSPWDGNEKIVLEK